MISEPQAPPTPVCVDCKHCILHREYPNITSLAECALTPVVIHPVNGARRYVYCENERTWDGHRCGFDGQHCGPAGKNFEPKD
jgi:hypothetical protein